MAGCWAQGTLAMLTKKQLAANAQPPMSSHQQWRERQGEPQDRHAMHAPNAVMEQLALRWVQRHQHLGEQGRMSVQSERACPNA